MAKQNKIYLIILLVIVLFGLNLKKEAGHPLEYGPPYTEFKLNANMWYDYLNPYGDIDICKWDPDVYYMLDDDANGIYTAGGLYASGIATGAGCRGQYIEIYSSNGQPSKLGIKVYDANIVQNEWIDVPAVCLSKTNIAFRLYFDKARYTETYNLGCCAVTNNDVPACNWNNIKTFVGIGSGHGPPEIYDMAFMQQPPLPSCDDPADTNNDCEVTLQEVVDYAKKWVNNQGVSLSQVINSANLWVDGGKY